MTRLASQVARWGTHSSMVDDHLWPPEGDPISYTNAAPTPDGSSLAWVSDRTGRPRAWLAPLDDLSDARLVAGVDDDVTAMSWSPDGHRLAVQLGAERTRVRLVGPAGRVRDIAPGAAGVTLGDWSPTGHRLGVTIFDGRSDVGQACLVDVRDGTSTVLAAGPEARVCAVSGDGRRAVVRLGRRGRYELELIDLRSGARTPLLPGGGATVADARFHRDRLHLHTDAGRDRPALLAVDLRGRSAHRVVAARADADLHIVALHPDAARMALVWKMNGGCATELLDLRSGGTFPVTAPPGDVVSAVVFIPDGLLVASEGTGLPSRISRQSLPTGPVFVLLADEARPGLVDPTVVTT